VRAGPAAETEVASRSEEQLPLTRRLPSEPDADDHDERRQRRMALFGAGAVIIALIVGAVVAGGGGGGGGDGGGGGGQTASGQTGGAGGGGSNTQGGRGGGGQGGTAPLSETQLIAAADATCLQAQNSFLATRAQFPDGETTPDVEYSRILTGVSGQAVDSLAALRPPASISAPYAAYVEAYRRVHQYDLDALAAAEQGDTTAYLAARENRNNEQLERFTLARQIGLQECSRSPD
jgi:hypothetical protein